MAESGGRMFGPAEIKEMAESKMADGWGKRKETLFMILPSVKQKTIIYHKKQKPNTAKTKSEMPQKTKLPKGVECGKSVAL